MTAQTRFTNADCRLIPLPINNSPSSATNAQSERPYVYPPGVADNRDSLPNPGCKRNNARADLAYAGALAIGLKGDRNDDVYRGVPHLADGNGEAGNARDLRLGPILGDWCQRVHARSPKPQWATSAGRGSAPEFVTGRTLGTQQVCGVRVRRLFHDRRTKPFWYSWLGTSASSAPGKGDFRMPAYLS